MLTRVGPLVAELRVTSLKVGRDFALCWARLDNQRVTIFAARSGSGVIADLVRGLIEGVELWGPSTIEGVVGVDFIEPLRGGSISGARDTGAFVEVDDAIGAAMDRRGIEVGAAGLSLDFRAGLLDPPVALS